MSDESILNRIEALVAEEHKLQRREEDDATDDDALEGDRGRLDQVSVVLESCWVQLPQHRARRHPGHHTDEAEVRDAGTVENYRL